MKILMLTWEYPPRIVGGIARVVYDLSQKLTKEGLPDALMVDTSYICTFDSFALALVKQYHYLLNLLEYLQLLYPF